MKTDKDWPTTFSEKNQLPTSTKKPTEIGKTKEKYSTMSSVEEIEGNGKICNQISTGQANDGKYSTSGVEESPVKGKGSEPSTGLKDVVAETLDPNSGRLSNNGGWQTSRERPNKTEEKRIDESTLGKKGPNWRNERPAKR